MGKYLAIIPARGGSKRLPRKNVLDLCKKPLIAWSIEAALKSDLLKDILVTSDDDEVLSISSNYGVMSIKRPLKLASDTSHTFEAIEHAIYAMAERYEYIVLLQPTSPLRTSKHIDQAITFLELKKADAVVSVCELEHPSEWNMSLQSDKNMSEFSKKLDLHRSQDYKKSFRLNGAIYICKTKKLLENKSFFLKENIFAYEMSREDSIDIDEALDFKLAQLILESS